MKRASAKIFPKLLSFEQKQRRMDIAGEILTEDYDDRGDKRKIETGAVGDIKNAGISVLYLRRVILKGDHQIVFDILILFEKILNNCYFLITPRISSLVRGNYIRHVVFSIIS